MSSARLAAGIGRSRLAGLGLAALIVAVGGVRAAEPKAFTQAVGDLTEIDLVPIPGGSVTLPDSVTPGKTVTVTIKPLYVSKTELRWEQFDPFLFRQDLTEKEIAKGVDAKNRPSMPYVPPDRGFGHDGWPTISISYLAAVKYCEWLSKKTGKAYRLPTEAEWQWACLGGGKPAKLSAEDAAKVAWFKDNSEAKTHESGKLAANGYGLVDMLGNAREWAVTAAGNPVLKGGGYADEVVALQAGSRAIPSKDWQKTDPQNPKSRWWLSDAPWAGFRIVCEIP
jgi:formylglycine-generating enzyme required for sulfatase activity